MKKLLSIFLSICMLLSITSGLNLTAFADVPSSGSCGENISYNFNSSTGILTISGKGSMAQYDGLNRSPFEHSNIKKVVIKSGVENISNYAFNYCSELTNIEIPSTVKSIGTESFRNCTKLTGIVIPEGVKSIGHMAFFNCLSITSINIPSTTTDISERALDYCPKCSQITVASSNPSYSSKDGILFNKEKTVLILFPINSNITGYSIPESVTSISVYAFADCKNLTGVKIPSKVAVIPDAAFDYCEKLSSIGIPKSVTKIESYAFSETKALKDVYYSGSESEWNKIEFGEENEYLKNAIIHFNSVIPEDKVTTKTVAPVNDDTTTNKSKQTDSVTKVSVTNPKKTKFSKVKPGKKLIKLTWKKVSGVSGYQIQYSLKKNMKKSKKKTVKGAKKTKVTIKKLKSKKKYYVRIRTYKVAGGKKIYSKWSKIKKVKVK